LIQLEEGASELRRYSDNLEMNPERLHEVEQRLNLYMDLSRKHQVAPDALYAHFEQLEQELNALSHSSERLIELEQEIEAAQVTYGLAAGELTKVRQRFSDELNQKITESLQTLNMEGAVFQIDLQTNLDKANAHGADIIEFLVSANPGQPLQPIAKVASGGELSRMSLAIQVIIAERVTTPTLLFDEVDVGVSGPTASSVGKLMRKLSNNAQVICVTHLPQVACYGHQQQFVSKHTENGSTQTSMRVLDETGRVNELARLLGGDQISSTSKANAKELLGTAKAA
jgi:DNA repair protein RecN (Recombination protein N)